MKKGKWCPLQVVWIWASRATGIGYQKFLPFPQERFLGIEEESNALVRQVEQLERELRRRGELPHQD